MEPGTLRLNEPFSGWLTVSYAARSPQEIPPYSPWDNYPLIRSVATEEVVTDCNSLTQAIITFRTLYRVTRDEKWLRAERSASNSLKQVALLTNPIYFFRRDSERRALSYRGTKISSTNPYPIIALRNPDQLVQLYIPASNNSQTQFRQAKSVSLAETDLIQAELGASVDGIVSIALTTTDGVWEAGFVCENNQVQSQTFRTDDFIQWNNATEWYAGQPVYSFKGATGVVTQAARNLRDGNQNIVVARFELAANLDFAGAGLQGNFASAPSFLIYGLSGGAVTLRLKDGSGWHWERSLPATGGQINKIILNWGQFQLSSEQESLAGAPIAPDSERPIQKMEFLAQRDPITLLVYAVGGEPHRLTPPVVVTAAIISRISEYHILLIGDVLVKPPKIPTYTPGIIPEMVTQNGDITDWRGGAFSAYQPISELSLDDLAKVDAFWAAAQTVYYQKNGLKGPLAPHYEWANRVDNRAMREEFDWAEGIGSSGILQAKAIATIARRWYEVGSGVAGVVAMEFIRFLDDYWGNGGAIALVEFPETSPPIPGNSPVILALYVNLALHVNLAGGDRAISFRVLQKSLAGLLENTIYPVNQEPQADSSYSISEILTALSAVKSFKNSLKYPTPSDSNDRSSDFAAKLVTVSKFEPPLNLPERAFYGLSFTIPTIAE